MSETREQASIRQGVQAHFHSGAVGGVGCYVDDDDRPTVILSVGPSKGESSRQHLRQGDRLELGKEVWEISEIRSPGATYWGATLTRVS